MSTEREPLNWLLHDAMMAAESIFWAELQAAYGHGASSMRYTLAEHDHEPINVAKRQFIALCYAWSRYYREQGK